MAKVGKKFNERAKVIKALAHPTRLFIVEELSRKSRYVCDLTQMVGVDISTISKHLSVLKNAGIVKDEKQGLQVCYRLSASCAMEFLHCIDGMIARRKK